MALDLKRFSYGKKTVVRDIRPMYVRFGDWLQKPNSAFAVCAMVAAAIALNPAIVPFMDLILISALLFLWWLRTRSRALEGKLPLGAPYKDPKNRSGKPEGILFLGNDKRTKQQIWYTNSDARTHILYLGTTGSGKTEGLKSIAVNALTWGSGFVYIDGKADTDLWSSLCAMALRFGRDDDLLVLNYMTGNSDERAPSNTMNPFSSGSASYLSNMLVSLMPEAEGDNAMWKERAVALINALMPALTWKRDHQEMPLSINVIRDYLNLNRIIQLSRDEALPERLRTGIKGYLETLPGYVDESFDDDGKEKPMGPDQPMVDTTTVRQQHGYLTMQFTRALQSLGDNYGYIFDAQAADVDMVDVVLNRRILVVLIPALEKSSDETANLGKIVAATIKGMMGQTLGATLEGESSTVIENKPTHSATPFITIFDEVGYYTAPGMAVMAAQARSLGFSLVFAAQDLQALEKRVKEEARSMAANCNIKIFGKLQDPTQTREYFENQIGNTYIIKTSGYQLKGGMSTGGFYDTQQASVDKGTRADYDDLKEMVEGEAIISFGIDVVHLDIFYSNPGHAKAMRVTRFVPLPKVDDQIIKHSSQITKLRDLMVHKTWTALNADVAVDTPMEIEALVDGYQIGIEKVEDPVDHGICAVSELHARKFPDEAEQALEEAKSGPVSAPAATPPSPVVTQVDKPQAPQPDVKEGVKWDDLVKEADTEPTTMPVTSEPAKADYIKAQLNEEVQRILTEAGQNLRQSLFKNKDTDTDQKE